MQLRSHTSGERPLRPPPHIPIRVLREAVGVTLDELAIGIGDILNATPPSRGTLSAIETGRRGASPEILGAIEQFFRLTPGSITTSYVPRARLAS